MCLSRAGALFLLAVRLCAQDAPFASAASSAADAWLRSWALCISTSPEGSTGAADALDVARAVTRLGFDRVLTLRGTNACRDLVLASLVRFRADAGEGGLFFLFFDGEHRLGSGGASDELVHMLLPAPSEGRPAEEVALKGDMLALGSSRDGSAMAVFNTMPRSVPEGAGRWTETWARNGSGAKGQRALVMLWPSVPGGRMETGRRNSVFAAGLAEVFNATAGRSVSLTLEELDARVGKRVRLETGGRQEPMSAIFGRGEAFALRATDPMPPAAVAPCAGEAWDAALKDAKAAPGAGAERRLLHLAADAIEAGDNARIAEVFLVLARLPPDVSRPDTALAYTREAARYNTDPAVRVELAHRAGGLLTLLGDPLRGAAEHREAIRQARRLWGPSVPGLMSMLLGQGLALEAGGAMDDAATALAEGHNLWETAGSPDVEEGAELCEGLGRVYGRRNNPFFARRTYEQALAIRRRMKTVEAESGASVLQKLGEISAAAGDPAAAIPLFREALDVALHLERPDALRVASLRRRLGEALAATGDREAAIGQFREALSFWERREDVGAMNAIEPARILRRVAELMEQARDDERADAMYAAAMARLARATGVEAVTERIACLQGRSRLLKAAGRPEAALGLIERALSEYFAAHGMEDPGASGLCLHFAGELEKQGDFSRAVEFAGQAQRLREQGRQPDHPDVHAARQILARSLTAMGDFARAEPIIREQLARLEGASTADARRERAAWQEQMGICRMRQKDWTGAVTHLQMAWEHALMTGDGGEEAVVRLARQIAEARVLGGRGPDALTILLDALSHAERRLDTTHPSIGALCGDIGRIRFGRGEYFLAREYLERAYLLAGSPSSGFLAEARAQTETALAPPDPTGRAREMSVHAEMSALSSAVRSPE